METPPPLIVCAPLALEVIAVRTRQFAPHVRVVRTGMGAARSRSAAVSLAREPARAVVVAGFGGGVDPSLEPGYVVVADAVSALDGRADCDSEALALLLRGEGLQVVVGTIASRDHLVEGDERRELFEQGATAVDMESAWLAAAASGRPFSVVRAVVDAPRRELLTSPLATLRGGARAYSALRRVGRALGRWASGRV
jgi:4-hydroxy-3-methylbut-2-en-1-yl diphosphate reductase